MNHCIHNMRHFITNNKLNILGHNKFGTFAANSSPMNNPSFILIGPKVTSCSLSDSLTFILYYLSFNLSSGSKLISIPSQSFSEDQISQQTQFLFCLLMKVQKVFLGIFLWLQFIFRMFENRQKEGKKKFISYSKNNKENKVKELNSLEELTPTKTTHSSHMFHAPSSCTTETNQTIDKASLNLIQGNKCEKQLNYRVDENTTLLKGKLVYLEEQNQYLTDKRFLLEVLRENNINMKQYIYGDRKKIIESIIEQHKQKQIEKINTYIEKNLKNDSEIEIYIAEDFEAVKKSIFSP